jgi:hypothetical protein
MNWRALTMAAVLIGSLGPQAHAAEARVKKVLLHLLDHQGRHTINASLYDRDAYQAYLRKHPSEQGGLRFDVQWTADRAHRDGLTLRIEVRSLKTRDSGQPNELYKARTLEAPVHPHGVFGWWSSITMPEKDFKEFGEINAWRASLWDGDRMVAEQKSFLW